MNDCTGFRYMNMSDFYGFHHGNRSSFLYGKPLETSYLQTKSTKGFTQFPSRKLLETAIGFHPSPLRGWKPEKPETLGKS
jgi:hypothetical protein